MLIPPALLLLITLTSAQSQNWHVSDVQKVTYATAKKFNARCIVLLLSSDPSIMKLSDEVKLAGVLAKVQGGWHPQVGVQTLQNWTQRIARIKQSGRVGCVKPLFIVLENEESKKQLEEVSLLDLRPFSPRY